MVIMNFSDDSSTKYEVVLINTVSIKDTTVNPAFKTIHERCENKRVKTMCNTEICYFIYKVSPSSFVKYEYVQFQNK